MTLTEVKNKHEHYFEDEKGLKQGEYKMYFGNGSLYFQRYYKDNKKHGECKNYYANGQLSNHCYYKDDKLHGEYKGYFSNGSLSGIRYYSSGQDITDMYNKLNVWKSL